MFSLGERVVYPGHGVAEIARIVEKTVAGRVSEFFELRFLHKGATVLVPVSGVMAVGMRKLVNQNAIDDVLSIIRQRPSGARRCEYTANWSKRNKEYQGRILSGDLCEIGMIYRDLHQMSTRKELSFGEKSLLSQTESLLAEEISAVNDSIQEKTAEELRSLAKQA